MASYYRPYTSGSDSDSGSESGSESDSSQSSFEPAQPANFRALAEGLSLTEIAGPSFDISGEIVYAKKPFGYPISNEKADISGEKLTATTQSINSIIMLNSTDRDRSVFPQPTNVTLRLPRVYSNVTSFQLVQIKLLSSFFYFRESKQNTKISIIEYGRKNLYLGELVDTIISTQIHEGTYDINSLISELTTNLNNPPVFYDFPNGFQEFALRFATTGDFSINFNLPGDTYYDSLQDVYISNPTMALIVSKYFQGQYAGLSSYTTDQIKIAYYYPVIKEALMYMPLNLDIVNTQYLLPGETAYTRCIYTFQGIDDKVVLEVISLNIETLDQFRLDNTFRYYNVNSYTVSLQPQSNRVIISTTSLNKSLVTLLTNKQTQYLSDQLAANNITAAQYAAYQAQNALLLAVLNDMFYFIQKYLAVYFGIPFNQYDISYIANPSYTIPIRDATNASGISSNFDVSVLSRNTPPISTNIIAQFQQGSQKYWPGYSNTDVLARPINLDLSSNYPYSIQNDRLETEHRFIDLSSEQLYANQLLRYSDIIVPLDAAKYTIFRFKSPVRQTLQIETLPRPTKYRYLNYNSNYDAENRGLFDNSYCFVNTSPEKLDWILTRQVPNIPILPVPGYSLINPLGNFGQPYSSMRAAWEDTFASSYIGKTKTMYGFVSPVPSYTDPAPRFRYPLAVTITTPDGEPFISQIIMFVYRDRAALLADYISNGNESPFNYIASVTTSTDVSSATVTFDTYDRQTYYVLSRTTNATSPLQTYCIVPWYPSADQYTALTSTLNGFDPLADPTTPAALLNTNYAYVTDPTWNRLPVASNLIPVTKVDPLFSPLTYSTVNIGYDVNGVSTDFTDYFGYTPNFSGTYNTSAFRIDPVNGYLLQAGSPYDVSSQTYFGSNSANTILMPGGRTPYMASTVMARHTSIVHPYFTTYIPNSEDQISLRSGIKPSLYIKPFTQTTTSAPIGGYEYSVSNGDIQFGEGVMGISFVPQQGSWDIQRAMFASVFSGNAGDPNDSIKHLGVFLTSSLPKYVSDLHLTSSIATLGFSKKTVYNNINLNFGFGVEGATFYEFTRDESFSNHHIYGYSQIRRQFNPDSNAIYSLVPFDEDGKVTHYNGLLGSLVPYPRINNSVVDISNTYYDGNATPDGKQLVLPKATVQPPLSQEYGGPPQGYDDTQAKYELSMPIGTTALHYVESNQFINNPTTMQSWGSLPTMSNPIFDCQGFVLTFDSVFHIYSYATDTADRSLKEVHQITVDQVLNAASNASYIGVAANETAFAFFSYSDDNTLRIRTMNPSTGEMLGDYSMESPFQFSEVRLMNVTYNNGGGFAMSVLDGVRPYAYYIDSIGGPFVTVELSGADPDITHFIVRQSPKTGDPFFNPFYIYPCSSTGGIQKYLQFKYTTGAPNVDSRYTVTISPDYDFSFTLIQYSLGGTYTNPIISREPYKDYLLFLSPTSNSIYEITAYTGTTATLTPSVYTFPGVPEALYQGPFGGKWALYDGAFYGNRNDSVDLPRRILPAWQIFYPTQRIVFTKVANNFTFMQDRTGIEYPEYPHTAITVYDSLTKLQNDLGDISNELGGKWGVESSGNIVAGDYGFSGEIFNASIFSAQLNKNTVDNPYYYIALRNYTPTEKSQVLLRCSLNNRYDFGYVKLADLSGEVAIAATSSNLFSPEYYDRLLGFNSNFILPTKNFGANIIKGYNGSNLTNITGFGDLYQRFTALYATYNAQIQLVQNINSNITSNINTFIQTDLKYILPPSALSRQRFTDPLTFAILWKQALSPEYEKLEQQWGLGWNLGFDKVDTYYATIHSSPSFFKILDDYINLRLNPEYDMNRMDSGAKENLSQTKEATGSTKAFHAKLLLAPFGSYAQTLISNPISFMPPLGRMDRLSFQWLDTAEIQIDNNDCEWNVVVQIVEKKDIVEIPKAKISLNGR